MPSGDHSLQSVAAELKNLFAKGLGPEDVERFTQLVSEFHAFPGDEKKKLDDKDQHLVTLIAVLRRLVLLAVRSGAITNAEQILFLAIAGVFDQIESILWELKGHSATDPLPKPDPLPPLPPDPDDDDNTYRL